MVEDERGGGGTVVPSNDPAEGSFFDGGGKGKLVEIAEEAEEKGIDDGTFAVSLRVLLADDNRRVKDTVDTL